MRKIYSKDEFIAKTGIGESTLDGMLKAQLLKPAGRVDGQTPYFDAECLEMAAATRKLLGIGYTLEEVSRIRRKVGLPAKVEESESVRGPLLTVGELAKRLGTNPRAIKHWEEKGIIEPDSHSPGGFRLYGERYVQICILLQDLQNLGYALDQIKVVADLAREVLVMRKDPEALSPELTESVFRRAEEQMSGLRDRMRSMEESMNRWRRILRQHEKEMSAMRARFKKSGRGRMEKVIERKQLTSSQPALEAATGQ